MRLHPILILVALLGSVALLLWVLYGRQRERDAATAAASVASAPVPSAAPASAPASSASPASASGVPGVTRGAGETGPEAGGGVARPPSIRPASAPDSAVAAEMRAQFEAETNAILRREMLQRWHAGNRPEAPVVARVALGDADPTVVLHALDVLRAGRSGADVPALLNVLSANADRPDGYGMPIRAAAILALGACGDGSVIPVLAAELGRHEDLSHDNVIVAAMGEIGHASALVALDRQVAYLSSFKPTESIVRESLNEAMAITLASRNRIIGGSGK